MIHLRKEEYYQLFKDKEKEALDRAWKNRDFEIDLYWKRATYFWAFTAAAFGAYFALVTSKDLESKFPQLNFLIICLGLVFSVAWLLVNCGSKKWQTNWEKHIDMLEDKITGPLYKTVINKNSYSVSNINIIVNAFVILIWVILGANYLYNYVTIKCDKGCCPDIVVILSMLSTLVSIAVMLFGYGKTGSERRRGFKFSKRNVQYNVE